MKTLQKYHINKCDEWYLKYFTLRKLNKKNAVFWTSTVFKLSCIPFKMARITAALFFSFMPTCVLVRSYVCVGLCAPEYPTRRTYIHTHFKRKLHTYLWNSVYKRRMALLFVYLLILPFTNIFLDIFFSSFLLHWSHSFAL